MANLKVDKKDSFAASLVDVSPDSFERNGQFNNREVQEHRRKNEYTSNSDSKIVLAPRVNPEKPASTSVRQRVEGRWPLPSSDNHSPVINVSYNRYQDVTTIDQKHDSFEPYRDIQPRNGARHSVDNRVLLPRPPRSIPRPKHSSPADSHQIDSEENAKPDWIPDCISHTEDHRGDSKLEKAKQCPRHNGIYIKNFIKTLLLLIVYIFIVLNLMEFLIRPTVFNKKVLKLMIVVLSTIRMLALCINSIISGMIDSLFIQSYTEERCPVMRKMATKVLAEV